MVVKIEIPTDIEASLVAQARDHGMALPEYVGSILREQVRSEAALPVGSPKERAFAWFEGVKDLPHTPPLSDEAISRENIYDLRG